MVTQCLPCQGINLRRNDGSALNMKNLREPMGMVMKVSGEAGNSDSKRMNIMAKGHPFYPFF